VTTLLVTGANRGIGLALVRGAVGRGDEVVATVRPAAATEELDRLASRSGRVRVVTMDVADERSVGRAAALVDGGIDVVVCNAAHLPTYGGLTDPRNTGEEWRTTLMTNVAGPFFTVRAFLPQLLRSASPRVALMSSGMASSRRPLGGAHAYRASKAAVTNLAFNLAVDLAPLGVAVAAYSPGWVNTEMGGAEAPLDAATSAAGLLDRFDHLSLGTTGRFEDHLGAVVDT
jgi:NAD(P)-dependent dehydrogenase (short-subunit alcohol dehydrogenase family)